MFGKGEKTLATVIGPDSKVRGEIQSKGTVRIDGAFEGTVRADWLIVGESGLLLGEAISRGTVVAGKLQGTVHTGELTEITAKGQVLGEIFTRKLSVAEGGVFEGRSHMLEAREPEGAAVLPLIPGEK